MFDIIYSKNQTEIQTVSFGDVRIESKCQQKRFGNQVSCLLPVVLMSGGDEFCLTESW